MPEIVNRFLRAVLPIRCVFCGEFTAGAALCPGCDRDLPWLDPRGVALRDCPQVFAALAYEYPVDRLITACKFQGCLSHARVLGELLAGFLLRARRTHSLALPELLVPVPLHTERLRERGYNQALEIARPVAALHRLSLAPSLLRRTRATAEQSGLSGEQRRHNVAGSFAVTGNCRGLRIAVIDDVVTTGSTAGAAAHALCRAGALHCDVWAVALA
jgi:ComF family protein